MLNEESQHTARTGSLVPWLAMSAVAVIGLALLGVHLPARVKWLGAFAIIHGAVTGWVLGQLAIQTNCRPSKWLFGASFLLVMVGQVGLTVQSYRIWMDVQRKDFEESPTARIAREMESADDVPDDMRRSFEGALIEHQQRTSFSGYLRRRVSPLGIVAETWPTLFWAAEVLLGSLAGAGAVFFRVRPVQPNGLTA